MEYELKKGAINVACIHSILIWWLVILVLILSLKLINVCVCVCIYKHTLTTYKCQDIKEPRRSPLLARNYLAWNTNSLILPSFLASAPDGSPSPLCSQSKFWPCKFIWTLLCLLQEGLTQIWVQVVHWEAKVTEWGDSRKRRWSTEGIWSSHLPFWLTRA